MSKWPVHIYCYWGVRLANYKLTSQLYAQLVHSDVGSDILGSKKDEEEAVNIRPRNELSRALWSKYHKCKNSLTYLT